MSESLRREAEFIPMGPAGGFVLTDDEVAAIGEGARTFPVTLTVNGGSYPLRLARMGGVNVVGVRREIREQVGLALGEVVTIEIVRDDSPREVEVPQDFADALALAPQAQAAYQGMAYSHRKEYVRWITEAKREQTRTARVAKAVQMLSEGKHR